MHLGRVYHPVQHSLMSQLVATKAGATFMGFGEARVPFGKTGFEEFRQQAGSGSLKTVFWFGGMYPYSYPELMPELSKVALRVSTSIFRPEMALPGLVLPVPSELEKESTGHSYWGEVSRHPVAAAYNGARPLARILVELATVTEQPVEPMPEAGAREAVAMALAALSGHQQAPAGAGFCLLGEKRASGIGGFYDAEDEIRLSARDAAKLGVGNGQHVRVESASGKAEFEVRVTAAVPEGVISIGVNAHRNRALFPLAQDAASGETVIAPAQVQVVKSAMVSKPAVELIARAG
jgi:anaerobic selenocysteine-containing dehydrogenase